MVGPVSRRNDDRTPLVGTPGHLYRGERIQRSEERMWILIGLLVGLVAVGVLLVAALIARRRGEPTRLGTHKSGDQWLTL